MKTFFVAGLSVCLLLMFGNCSKSVTPKICWELPGGDTVMFYHKKSSFLESDHAKCLVIKTKSGNSAYYEFAASHSGYEHVELRIDQKNETIWIVDHDSKTVGCSLNIKTNTFIDENGQHPKEITATAGRILPAVACVN